MQQCEELQKLFAGELESSAPIEPKIGFVITMHASGGGWLVWDGWRFTNHMGHGLTYSNLPDASEALKKIEPCPCGGCTRSVRTVYCYDGPIR